MFLIHKEQLKGSLAKTVSLTKAVLAGGIGAAGNASCKRLLSRNRVLRHSRQSDSQMEVFLIKFTRLCRSFISVLNLKQKH
jgi:hypothetical protein